MKPFLLLLLFGMTCSTCGLAAAPPVETKSVEEQSLDELLGLMRQRLAIMHDVARYKWAKKAPIEDPARERALLEDVAERGKTLNLEPSRTRAFFAAQIEAAKLVQFADFRRWESEGKGTQEDTPDLAGELRPRIDRLNQELLAALAKRKFTKRDRNAEGRLRSRAEKLLVGEGLDAKVRAAAIAPLIEFGD